MQRPVREVIDLTRDSDGEGSMLSQFEQPRDQRLHNPLSPTNTNLACGPPFVSGGSPLNDEELAQLAAMDEIDPFWPFVDEAVGPLQLDTRAPVPTAQGDQRAAFGSPDTSFTADTCLQQVLEIFPDVSHEYVTGLYDDFDSAGDYEALPAPARFDNIIERLLANSDYPRESNGKQTGKRKRQSSVEKDLEWYENANRPRLSGIQIGIASTMLKAEFPDVAIRRIDQSIAASQHLYQTYVAIAAAIDAGDPAFSTGRRSHQSGHTLDDFARWSDGERLFKEMEAARLAVATIRSEKAEAEERKKLEHENLKLAMERGETGECQACFDDLPLNRMIHCDGTDAHFTCFSCAETYIRTEVGADRCRVTCVSGCGRGYPYNQLQRLPDKPLLEKLSRIEQQEAIRNAGLEDLEDCPFCDFKMEMPPVEENFVFKCLNPECGVDSCRRCRNVSHLPISCEQYAKEHKVSARHKVEEAMTAAMIRSCNKCQKKFIKDYGCNKMICPSCNNMQCYVCSQTITNYQHFTDRTLPGRTNAAAKCPLYDNAEERHDQEVKLAEAKARTEALTDNPDISAEDLEIKMSDAVKRGEANRVQQAGPLGLGLAVEGDYRLPNPRAIANLVRQERPFVPRDFIQRPIRPDPQLERRAFGGANGQQRIDNNNPDHNNNDNHNGRPPPILAVPRLVRMPHAVFLEPAHDHRYQPPGQDFAMNQDLGPVPRRAGNVANRDLPPQFDGNIDVYLNDFFNIAEALGCRQRLLIYNYVAANQAWMANDLPKQSNNDGEVAEPRVQVNEHAFLLPIHRAQPALAGVPPPPLRPNLIPWQALNQPQGQIHQNINGAFDHMVEDQPINWGWLANGGQAAFRGAPLFQPPPNPPQIGPAGAANHVGDHRINGHAAGHVNSIEHQAQPAGVYAPGAVNTRPYLRRGQWG